MLAGYDDYLRANGVISSHHPAYNPLTQRRALEQGI
jgi:hypothetical protein